MIGTATAPGSAYRGQVLSPSVSSVFLHRMSPAQVLAAPGGVAVAFCGTQRRLDHLRCVDLPVRELLPEPDTRPGPAQLEHGLTKGRLVGSRNRPSRVLRASGQASEPCFSTCGRGCNRAPGRWHRACGTSRVAQSSRNRGVEKDLLMMASPHL